MSLTRAKYRATPDTLQDLQWTDLRVDANGALIVTNAAGATTSPSKLEDSPHASGDMGTFVLGVRNDSFTILSNTNGDYTPIAVDQWGDVLTSVVDIVPGTGFTRLGKAEDAAHTSGETGVMSLAVRNDAAANLTDTTLDYSPIAVTPSGAVQFALSAVRANGADTISNSGALGRITDASGNLTQLAVMPLVFNGASFDRLRSVGAAGSLAVEQGPYLSSRKIADGQVKGSAGFVHTVTISPTTATPTAGLLTIYDSLTETGTILYSEWVFATAPGHTVHLDVPAATGIYVGYDGTLTNVSVAVSYR